MPASRCSAEKTPVGGQGDGEIGQADLDGTRIRGDGRIVIEVLTGTTPSTVAGSAVGRLDAWLRTTFESSAIRFCARRRTTWPRSTARVKLVDDMLETMYAPGIGLAAPQVGVDKRLFVWDIGDGPNAMVNPEIIEGDGEWVFEEGCLSVPGLSWEIVRPKKIHIVGRDLDGNG